jgi:MOSC domain-containing protein YiiM
MDQIKAVVEAVCLSTPDVRVAKAARPEAFIGPYGLVGDRHEAEYRRSKRGVMGRNLRQWSAVSTEEVEALCAEIGIEAFKLGAMGENLRLKGVTLGDVPAGSILEFESGARLEVTDQNDPCVNAAKELAQTYGAIVGQYFVKCAWGKRGVVGVVLEPGVVKPGDTVTISVAVAAS